MWILGKAEDSSNHRKIVPAPACLCFQPWETAGRVLRYGYLTLAALALGSEAGEALSERVYSGQQREDPQALTGVKVRTLGRTEGTSQPVSLGSSQLPHRGPHLNAFQGLGLLPLRHEPLPSRSLTSLTPQVGVRERHIQGIAWFLP